MTCAYCFDLDGTLIDSEVIWVEAVHAFLEKLTGNYPRPDAEQLVYGRSWHDIYQDIVRTVGIDMTLAEMEAETSFLYKEITSTRDIRIPNSIDLLKNLSHTHTVCVVSGSSRKTVKEAIDMMNLADRLAFFLGADDYSPGKPDPACYRLAAEKLAVPPASCVAFEDSNAGVLAAKAAGMRCVALTFPAARHRISREPISCWTTWGRFRRICSTADEPRHRSRLTPARCGAQHRWTQMSACSSAPADRLMRLRIVMEEEEVCVADSH